MTALIKQGWIRALLYFLVILALAITLQQPAGNLAAQLTKDVQLIFIISYCLMAAVFVLFTWLFKRIIDRENFIDLGFHIKDYKADAGMGLFTAIAILGAGTLILILTQKISITGTDFYPSALALQLGLMIVVAFSEEIVFRGYILNNLLGSINKWVALFISAALFALVHASNPGANVLPVVNVFLAGLLLGMNYIFTRNLWFAILLHLAWNYLQGPVLGYKVSGLETQSLLQQYVTGSDLWTGGNFGFEGSLLCTALLAVAILLWAYLFSHKYPGAIKSQE